jgi:hypothetical protein
MIDAIKETNNSGSRFRGSGFPGEGEYPQVNIKPRVGDDD